MFEIKKDKSGSGKDNYVRLNSVMINVKCPYTLNYLLPHYYVSAIVSVNKRDLCQNDRVYSF